MLLSICITTYNQMELLRRNVSEIIKYKGNDIEIVISDNCSEEPIEEMLHEFHDPRIRYCRTSENKGQDGNILYGFQHCRGEYIYLFRTKDIAIPEKLETVIQTIKLHPNAVYFLFSALDENGSKRMELENKVYQKITGTQYAHRELLIHPSGQIYKRKCLRLDVYKKYVQRYFPERNGCDVHQLIRMDLTTCGEFVTSSCFAWKYAYTLRSKNGSVNQTKKKINIYAPFYQYQRYKCEFKFADNELPETYKYVFMKQIMWDYGWRITSLFCEINEDKNYNRHYNSEPMEFSPYKEWMVFGKKSKKMLQTLKRFDKSDELWWYLLYRLCILGVYDIPKAYVKRFVYRNSILKRMWFLIRGIQTEC